MNKFYNLNVIKFLVFVFILVFFTLLIFIFKSEYKFSDPPEKTIAEYYQILKNQETILPGDKISEQQLQDLQKCGEDYKCYLKYYENFNAPTTLAQTFSNLNLLLKDYPEYQNYCHQITHGIGHAEFKKDDGDLGKALADFSTGKYFKNIATCGSGYFHGLLEQAVKEEKDKDKLVDYFSNICNQEVVKNIAGTDCIHGLGHAAYIQLDYNLEDAKYVCENVTKTETDRFNCLTGVFMEANLDLPKEEIFTTSGEGVNRNFNFILCDSQADKLAHRACYFETILQFKNFIKEKWDYSQMTTLCKNISDSVDRMACVKNVTIRSIIDVNYADINKMCLQNTGSRAERIFCVTNFAHRLALSINQHKNEEYYKQANDICKYLSPKEAKVCQSLIKNNPAQIYYVSEKDLNI
jgi:hypothetical protein